MLISMKLLRETVSFDYTAEELSKEFSLLGLEVESIERLHHKFRNIVTAKVENITQVKDTKLFKLDAFVKNEKFQIITAATNLHNGDIVPLALPHSTLANGVEIQPKEFKGVLSNGMLCSYRELGLDGEILSTEEKEGIFVFPDDTPVGTPVESVLPIDDEFIELSLLPDRADAFYLIGVARWVEILKARNEGRKADFSRFDIDTEVKLSGETNIPIVVSEKELAPFYSGRSIRNVTVKKSSLSLRQKLFMLRARPINNIVDITNFVLKFYGQPLHAFDADKVLEMVLVRNAKDGETLKTLDGVNRTLNQWNLVIADKERPIALAGVMGGEDTEVTFDTKNVLLESAYFLPSCISKSSRSLNLMTDASMLFEKGTDPEFPEKASLYAANFITREAGGIPAKSNIVSNLKPSKPVSVRIERIGKLLGEEISKENAKKYLEFEGFKFVDKGDIIDVYSPSFRRDINIEVDLIEEILRMKGYNSFDEKPIVSALKGASMTEEEEFTWNFKNELVRNGLSEIQTVSLISKELLSKANIYPENLAEVINPFSEEMSILRPYLFPVIMNVVAMNKKSGIIDVALFEIGKVFSLKSNKYIEGNNIGIALSGDRIILNPFKKSLPYDFYYLKGVIEEIFSYLNISPDFKFEQFSFLHPYQSAGIYVGEDNVGLIGAVSYEVIKNFDIKQKVYYAELDLNKLFSNSKKALRFESYPQYPPLKMDIAVVVNTNVPEGEVREAILSVAPKELKEITLFDIYKGKPLKDDEKNLAYSLSFSSLNRTLKRDEVEEFIKKLEEILLEKVGGKLRKE